MKRYRRSLLLGRETDGLRGVGDACRASFRTMTILSDFINEIARDTYLPCVSGIIVKKDLSVEE